jgi:predicted HTH transcriptional regulator
MKKPWEWDEDHLLGKIASGWKESIDLDFKQSGSLQNIERKKDEISKDVSAFANSAGGTIIYGIVEDGLIAQDIDTGSDPAEITKEWLENVIISRLQRRVDDIRIHQVELTTKSPGKVAYVITIPQSTRAPHQANDKKFYKRFNFQSVPMEEYEIRDGARRGDTRFTNIFDTYQASKLYTRHSCI